MARRTVYVTLSLLALISACLAHELCLSTDGPTNAQNTFCSAYNAHTCCSADTDAAIAALHAQLAVADATCNATLANLLCAQCDPWGAHIFGIELQIGRAGTPIPYLCPAYAQQVYNACASVPVNWPADSSPFGGALLGDAYANETAFCDDYCSPTILGAFCYNGTPYVPTYASAANYDGQLCLSYWGGSADGAGPMAVWMQDVGDGTMLVVFKDGEIRRRNRTSGQELGVFATIPNVYNNGEAGLLSIALHPSFLANGRWFAYYSQTLEAHPVACTADTAVAACGKYMACNNGHCEGNHVSVIAEFQSVNASQGLIDSGRELLYVVQPWGNHNGGQLQFDPEGYMLIALGDGGGGNDPNNRAQDLDSIFGKFLRIDVDAPAAAPKAYAIPASNPALSATWPEIYAYGFRNPWRSSFDASDPTRFFLADVGQDTREEVDIVIKGGNYGWRKYEGMIVNPTYPNEPDIPNAIPPIMDYDHSQGTSVIGGYIYRGRRDLTLVGRYLFGDLSSGLFLGSDRGNDTWAWVRLSYACGGACPSGSVGSLWSFYEDANRDVYVIGTGGIFRVSERDVCGLAVGNSTAVPGLSTPAPTPSATPQATETSPPSPSPAAPTPAAPTSAPSTPRPTQIVEAPAPSSPVETSAAAGLLANLALCLTLAFVADQAFFD